MLPTNRAFPAVAGLLMFLLAGALSAQPSNGYVFFAPGGETCCGATYMTLQLGVGGEAVLKKGIGVGAEIAALAYRQDFAGTVVGVFSPNGYYHFLHGDNVKVDPFVTGGYSLLFRTGHANYANFGGGGTYWFHPRLGARLEFRDQINTLGTIQHFWGVRFGLAFH
ncbi:MAG TPA: hypothetical protein VML19_06645 [Verrucomicrobiae bacterium]|nr:hypothetical protein [Verrucomicrobiae bacterium]